MRVKIDSTTVEAALFYPQDLKVQVFYDPENLYRVINN